MENKYENCIAIRNNTTGEIELFNFTPSGVYKAALLIYENYNDYSKEYFNALIVRDRLLELQMQTCHEAMKIARMCDITLHLCRGFALVDVWNSLKNYFIKRELELHRFDQRSNRVNLSDNVICSSFNKVSDETLNFAYDNFAHYTKLKSEMFTINGEWFSLSIKKYLRHCKRCGDLYFDQFAMQHDEIGDRELRGISNYLGAEGYCHVCISDNTDLGVCDNCGIIENSCDLTYVDCDGVLVCEDCLDAFYVQCEQCGEWAIRDNYDCIRTEDGRYFCSDRCAEYAGYHWSDNACGWIDYDDEHGDDYNEEFESLKYEYSNKNYKHFGEMRKGQKHEYLVGAEIEVDSEDTYKGDMERDYFYKLIDMMKYEPHLKDDGSLEHGFEICSNALSTKLFFEKEYWEKPFNHLKNAGWKSHDTGTCGLHFHVSKWFFGSTWKGQFNNVKKVIRFINDHYEDFNKMSRRHGDWNWCETFDFEVNQKTTIYNLSYNHDRRYHTINLERFTHTNGIEDGDMEFRICKGTLNPDTFLASADLFVRLARNSNKISWKNIGNVKLWLKGLKKETIAYLKDRGCSFEGALE